MAGIKNVEVVEDKQKVVEAGLEFCAEHPVLVKVGKFAGIGVITGIVFLGGWKFLNWKRVADITEVIPEVTEAAPEIAEATAEVVEAVAEAF